jgi:hypothetical protein
MTYLPRAISSLSVYDVFTERPETKRVRLLAYFDDEDRAEIHSNTFNLIFDRRIRKNVETSALMAVFLAKKFPDKKILLCNTYAGPELLQNSLASALLKFDVKIPRIAQRSASQAHPNQIEDGEPKDMLPNLRVLDFPIDTFSAWRLEIEIKKYDAQIILINSYEFSMIGSAKRKIEAKALVRLQQTYELSITILSHEMRRDVEAGIAARGAIGILSAFSESVWKMGAPVREHLSRMQNSGGGMNGGTMESMEQMYERMKAEEESERMKEKEETETRNREIPLIPTDFEGIHEVQSEIADVERSGEVALAYAGDRPRLPSARASAIHYAPPGTKDSEGQDSE